MKYVLTKIILAQFLCTTVWFAVNAALIQELQFRNVISTYVMSTQLGFILGTLVYAVKGLPDKFSPSKLFTLSAVFAAILNFSFVFTTQVDYLSIVVRLGVGFFLAGVYPVGMKICADYFPASIGKALGFLVGALVLGTALPHLLQYLSFHINWKWVIYGTSFLCMIGGVLIGSLADGPFRKSAPQFQFTALQLAFSNKKFKQAALGYFGHMWELYTFWFFVPYILMQLLQKQDAHISLYAFIIIAFGAIGCIIAGILTKFLSAKKIAFVLLLLSGICCVVVPYAVAWPFYYQIAFMIFWGIAVVADSPMYSSLVALHAPAEYKGAALTLVNCIGFALTIFSIALMKIWMDDADELSNFQFLAIGPFLGLVAMTNKK